MNENTRPAPQKMTPERLDDLRDVCQEYVPDGATSMFEGSAIGRRSKELCLQLLSHIDAQAETIHKRGDQVTELTYQLREYHNIADAQAAEIKRWREAAGYDAPEEMRVETESFRVTMRYMITALKGTVGRLQGERDDAETLRESGIQDSGYAVGMDPATPGLDETVVTTSGEPDENLPQQTGHDWGWAYAAMCVGKWVRRQCWAQGVYLTIVSGRVACGFPGGATLGWEPHIYNLNATDWVLVRDDDAETLRESGIQDSGEQNKTAELQAIVDKLPVIGDGARAVPGKVVWAAFRDGVFRGVITGVFAELRRVAVTFDETVQVFDEHVHKLHPLASCLHSTQAAAEAAKEARA